MATNMMPHNLSEVIDACVAYVDNKEITIDELIEHVKGTDNLRTAMAKTVGLPLGIAAKFILDGTITQRGLHIPISKEIYLPVLKELENHGITFRETKK
jgi:DNA gyrase/topoisomerase IV subunit A